jgi:GMP synthase-like glutamine amidotransferase
MSVLIVKNIASEGPGTIEDFLKEKGMQYSILDLFDCKTEIPDVRDYSHLVIMGGPMAVYEMDNHSFMSFEAAMIRAFIKSSKPVLGICLGAQMIAYAFGAKVYPGGTKEVGWYRVDITEDGMKDPALSTLSVDSSPVAEVFQWHGDTFDLPEKAVRMASSEAFQNQAFRYGDNIYALQFHIEVTPEMIREWFTGEEGVDIESMMNETNAIFPEYRKRAMKFYEKFFS